ncbi:MAG TPA: amidohydrolase family protein [Candidatus Limnocylindria bacterium]|jgi:imidazolonepropionase-like amidohydrolase|nr:amidohydrolase family protein [Candidatus Limnocylindria bacterium]
MRTVLEIDGLFDGTSAMSDAAVVIEDGEITWVGKRSRVPKTPKGERSRSLQAGGRFAVPGLINCHAHLTFDGTADFDAESRQSEAEATLKAFRNARLTLRSGVTTVRDLGANGGMVVELARQIERGALEGPRIIASARGITITGGHGTEVGRVADGADAVRAATREQVAVGASVIKLFSTGGVLGEGAGPELSAYTPEETRAAVEEAHRAGVRITTHAHGAEGMRIASEAGIDSIEHATLLDQQTIRVIKGKNVALVPTFSALRRIIDNGKALSARVMERARLVATKHQEGVRAAHKAGVRIAAGTDAGTPFNTHERFALELVYLTEAGLSLTEALVAATSLAADVVGTPKAGRIEAGAWADLLFVDGDPLDDLDVLQQPKAVWVRGVPVAP